MDRGDRRDGQPTPSVEESTSLEEALEELESIQAYDAAKAASDEIIDFEQAVEEIERERR